MPWQTPCSPWQTAVLAVWTEAHIYPKRSENVSQKALRSPGDKWDSIKTGREKDHCWAPSLEDVFTQRKTPSRDAQDSQGKPRFSSGAQSTGSSWHLNQKHRALCISQGRTDCWACPHKGKLHVRAADAYRRKDGCCQKDREHHLMWDCKWLPLVFLLKNVGCVQPTADAISTILLCVSCLSTCTFKPLKFFIFLQRKKKQTMSSDQLLQTK